MIEGRFWALLHNFELAQAAPTTVTIAQRVAQKTIVWCSAVGGPPSPSRAGRHWKSAGRVNLASASTGQAHVPLFVQPIEPGVANQYCLCFSSFVGVCIRTVLVAQQALEDFAQCIARQFLDELDSADALVLCEPGIGPFPDG